MKILKENWLKEFISELNNTDGLKIMSPFITNNMAAHLLDNFKGSEIKVITRFNLNDFKSGVSNLSALNTLLKNGAQIKGIKKLHSKTYIFDSKSAIITSANFTSGGFFGNYELGVKTSKKSKVLEVLKYFEDLWRFSPKVLTFQDVNEWEPLIKRSKPSKTEPLTDYGISITEKIIGSKKYFIKFYGTKDSRASIDTNIKEIVAGTHCHFAVTFSETNGRPRRYNDGDVVYIARMLEGGGYGIFGKAIAFKHNDEDDIASAEDKKHIPWKEIYPIYIRIKDPTFIDGSLKNCPSMNQLIHELKYDSFRRTKQRNISGEKNINPLHTLRQKPDVELSREGAIWLENSFNTKLKSHGKIQQTFLDSLYQGS